MTISTRTAQALGVPPGMRFYSVYVRDAWEGWVRGYDRVYALNVAKRRLGHMGRVTLREMRSAARIRRALTRPMEDIEVR